MDEGYIKLFRKFVDWEWYEDTNTKVLFIHLLFLANWKDGRFRGRTIPKGSLVTSLNKLSLGTNLTEREVRTALSHLKSTGEIDTVTTQKYTVISIKNWDMYQGSDTVTTDNRQTSDIQTTTIEERKKGRREEYTIFSKENICPTLPKEDVERIVSEWNLLIDCGIKPVTKLTPGTKRYDNLRARIKQYGADDVISAVRRIRDSDFLTGKATDFTITFDWFVKPNNFIKVFEGNYDRGETKSDWRKEWAKEYDRQGT